MAEGKITKDDLVAGDAIKIYSTLKDEAVTTLNAISKALDKLQKAQSALGVTTNDQLKIQRDQRIELNKLSIASKEAKDADDKLSRAKKQVILDLRKEAAETRKSTTEKNANIKATQSQERANKSLTGTFKNLLRSMVAFIGVRMFIQFIGDTFNLIKTFDALKFAMERITKNALDLSESYIFLKQITKDYGVTLIATTERWIKFLAAAKQSGVTLMDAQKIFGTMTKAAGVLGLKTDELSGIFLALEQMLSKGKVTTEELRRQLGERLPGAVGIMAASMGVTISELDKMMERGEVLSAEVLPGFADAVEIAFGLDTVDKIETLVAKQNRLTLAWQSFIQSMADGDGVIKWVFGNFFDLLGGAIERLDWLLMSSNQQMTIEVGKMTKQLDVAMNQQSKSILNAKAKQGERYQEIVDRVRDYETNKLNATTDEQLKIVEDNYTKDMSLLIAFTDKKDALNKEQAKAGLTSAKRTFDEDQALYDAQLEKVKELDKEKGKGSKAQAGRGAIAVRTAKKELKVIELSLIQSKAQFMLYRKWAEDSKVVVPKGGDDKGKSKKLRDIQDLQKEIKAKELESQIEVNKKSIEAEESSFTLKKDLLERNLKLEQEINDLILEDKIDTINKKADAEILAAGGVGTNRGIELEKERGQLLYLISQDLSAKKIELADKTELELDKIRKVESDKIQSELETQAHNLQIAKDKELAIVRSTATDKEDLAKKEAEINLRYQKIGNEQLIKIYEDIIQHLKDLGIETEKLERILEGLQNKSFAPDLEGEKNKFEEILELASQFNDALGGLFDAISARRLENIDAEINAEENKYDRLLELAKDDKAQTESIQRERDAALLILEKKRLKEEQKAAKVRKAQAMVDIAINTASGIMQIWGHSPDPTGLSQATLTAIISAIGALQIATVLATPIPKFAQGGTMGWDGKALINDGGNREYVERNGVILSSPIKNAVVDLQKGDTIHKDYNSLMNASIMTSLANDNKNLDSSKLKLIFDDSYAKLENVIGKSLSKAKFNNNISLNGFDKNQELYKNSLSRWN